MAATHNPLDPYLLHSQPIGSLPAPLTSHWISTCSTHSPLDPYLLPSQPIGSLPAPLTAHWISTCSPHTPLDPYLLPSHPIGSLPAPLTAHWISTCSSDGSKQRPEEEPRHREPLSRTEEEDVYTLWFLRWWRQLRKSTLAGHSGVRRSSTLAGHSGVRRSSTLAGHSGVRRSSTLAGHSGVRRSARSLGGFVMGLLLASLYGMITLFIQNSELSFCINTTVAIAALAAFSMGCSVRARATVMLTVPMLCSARGKHLLLFLVWSLVLQGPVTNTLDNFDRAATSVVCGVQLSVNQTRQLMERAATPLLPVLGKIRELTSNAFSVASRVKNLISALTESVRHVARTLRNVLHFLSDIGEVCNIKLGSPYMKCTKVFDDARENCMELLGIFNFLCYMVDWFRPLCGLAMAGQLFCIIPAYISKHVKARLAAPMVAAFGRMKQEFEFNMTVSVGLEVSSSSSQGLRQVSQRILQEVSSQLQPFHLAKTLLAYGGLLLLGHMVLQAARYKHRYLHEEDFDNVYITEQFEELDQTRAREGRPTALPLNRTERQTYSRPDSWHLSAREKRLLVLSTVSVLKHIAMGGLLGALDLLVYWVFELVHQQAKGETVARAPVLVAVQVNGSGYAADIFRDLVSSFDVLQKANITVLSSKCLMSPSKPDSTGYIIIGFLYGFTLFLVLAGSHTKRLRRLVCASYHPRREWERVLLLHSRILSQRRTLGEALRRAVMRCRADRGAPSLLHSLLLRLGSLLGVTGAAVCCMACGEGREEPDHMVSCPTQGCTGLYCSQCFQSMGRVCSVCMGPLTFQEDSQEELDSSDEEQVRLWAAALDSPNITQRRHRKLMKRRISIATQRQPSGTHLRGAKTFRIRCAGRGQGQGPDSTDAALSEPDMNYQDQSETESDSHASFPSYYPVGLASKDDGALQLVSVQSQPT
ncbi:DC-STAMP domain-containing protein 2 [Aplochiton taeniatus]